MSADKSRLLDEISIRNFKSIEDLKMQLGRVTVLIGENGSGKSNILEAISMLGAAGADKLDREFLVSRGIRMTDPSLMASAFPITDSNSLKAEISLAASSRNGPTLRCDLALEDGGWAPVAGRISAKLAIEKSISAVEQEEHKSQESPDGRGNEPDASESLPSVVSADELLRIILSGKPSVEREGNRLTLKFETPELEDLPEKVIEEAKERFVLQFPLAVEKRLRLEADKEIGLSRFLVYAPENSALRVFEEEGQIYPVGTRGEGLFRMIQAFAKASNAEILVNLKQSLNLIGWFVDFCIPDNLAPGESRLRIHDRFLGPNSQIDQRSANEGFLFLLFYFSVILSPETPPIFAIDNVDASLNPKLCSELMRQLCTMAAKYKKQIIVTTHNPAVLDGLNLNDDEQRLYVVSRNEEGRTRAKRIRPPKSQPSGGRSVKLSEAFLQGLLGGLPKSF